MSLALRHEIVLRTANFVFKCESVSFNQIRLYIRAAETYSASAARVMCFRTQPASRCVPPLHPFPRQIAAGSPVFSISDAPFSANFRECASARARLICFRCRLYIHRAIWRYKPEKLHARALEAPPRESLIIVRRHHWLLFRSLAFLSRKS